TWRSSSKTLSSSSTGWAPICAAAGTRTAGTAARSRRCCARWPMTSTPDARLLEAHDLALAALREIAPDSTIGPAAGYIAEDDGVVSLRFENRMGGYPGWYWTVSV